MVDLSALNSNQRRAVLLIDGPMLVLAGAGSGKTRVITHRIAHMIEEGIAPSTIVALSFTNKAAGEMRERLQAMIGKATAREVVLGTFHSVGAQMMRETPEGFGVPKRFSILDQGDQYGLVRGLLRDLGHHGPAGDRRYDLGAIVQRISLWKNDFIDPRSAADPLRHESDYDEVAAEVYPEYEDRLRSLGAVDFDDLVCRIAHCIDNDAELCAHWRQRYHYLLIDEYQDTNRAQLEVVRRLAGPRENICVVGDDDQAIYGWRGAKVSNILGFDMLF
ncbi:MAG TPA: DNA helicase UvrD, partial [Nannocystis exedens]|nr:DNA helicase UvrD [Nannocystis exedens]